MSSERRIGTVRELWRYPVKSMMGERLPETEVDQRGVRGDRAWATRDEVRGGIRGAKQIAELMRLAASYPIDPHGDDPAPPAEIRTPDGATFRTTDPDVHERLSAALDHPVTLWPLQPADDLDHYRRGPGSSDDLDQAMRDLFDREPDEPLPDLSRLPPEVFEYESPPGTYFDAYPLLLLTTTSLASLRARAPGSVVDVRRFRPNVLIDATDAGAEPFPEQRWLDGHLRIGEVTVSVTSPCPRCVMITRAFDDLPRDRGLMRTVVREAAQNLGVYAGVTGPGSIRVGDAVTWLAP